MHTVAVAVFLNVSKPDLRIKVDNCIHSWKPTDGRVLMA